LSEFVYLDSSAIVKLVIGEAESDALEGFLRGHAARASCGLARVEVPRAVADEGAHARDKARHVIDGMHLIPLSDELLDAAGALDISGLRSLDAIHVAAACELREDLNCVVTYDHRMASAAESLGLAVVAPS
jgi:predicted nucleic acid-binding protein